MQGWKIAFVLVGVVEVIRGAGRGGRGRSCLVQTFHFGLQSALQEVHDKNQFYRVMPRQPGDKGLEKEDIP